MQTLGDIIATCLGKYWKKPFQRFIKTIEYFFLVVHNTVEDCTHNCLQAIKPTARRAEAVKELQRSPPIVPPAISDFRMNKDTQQHSVNAPATQVSQRQWLLIRNQLLMVRQKQFHMQLYCCRMTTNCPD